MGKRVGTGCETQAASGLTAAGCSKELLLCVQGELLWHCWVPWAGWLRAARCSQAPSDQQLGQLLPPCCRCLPRGSQGSHIFSAPVSALAAELSSGPLDAAGRAVCRAGRWKHTETTG